MKKAVLFDMDGTLVNSIPKHMQKQKRVLKHVLNYSLTTEYFLKYCNGQRSHEYYKKILRENNFDPNLLQSLINYDKKITNRTFINSMKVFPHVKSLLKILKKEGYKLAIASSSPNHFVNPILKNNDIRKYFDTVITSNLVSKTKPNPDIFLLARKILGIPKANCIIVEDALNGFKAAKRSGMDCIALTTSLQPKDIPNFTTIVKDHAKLYSVIANL